MWPILDWPVYGNQILIYLNISVFYLYSQCSRSKFNFLFQLSSYTAEEAFFNISFAINMASQHSYCKFHFFVVFLIFFCRSKMPKTPKMLMKKHGYWWIIHGKLKVIFFFFQNVESDLRSCQISVIKVLVKQLMVFSVIIMFVNRTMGTYLKQSCVK